MKVLHTIAGLSVSSGGPSTCTHDLLDGLHRISNDVKLLTLRSRNHESENLGKGESWLIELDNDSYSPLCISRNISSYLKISDYDIYHCNAIWLYPSHVTCKTAREKNKPYVISTHGMLYPTALNVKRWKKEIMLRMWFKKDISHATCIHATCKQEMEYCRLFGYKGPIAIIPNPVVIPPYINDIESKKSSIKTIGFLGRLDPIKKVENVIYALSELTSDEKKSIRFQIIGKYDQKYEDFLKGEVERLELSDIVQFVGFITGEEKYNRLSTMWALMVPSAQENFGMIVPEALICRTPVYASTGTPWEELGRHCCGWWKDNSPSTILSIIRDILQKNEIEISEMGERGKRLIEINYEQEKVAYKMYDLYRWINGDIDKPDFVYV